MASWAPSYAMASLAPCTAMASWAPSSAMASFVCLFRSGGPRPVFLSMSVLRGLQSAHPPSPVELLRRGTRLPGGGSYVRVLLCVSCVPASCVHIWFVSCPCFMSLWVKYVPAVFVWLCVNYPVYLVPVFWVWFRLVYSLLPGVSCLSVLPWCLIKDYYLSLYPRLRVPVPPSCVHRDINILLFFWDCNFQLYCISSYRALMPQAPNSSRDLTVFV